MKNYYHILKIEYTANALQIKKAYRDLAKIYHPDSNNDLKNKEIFQDINDAYHILINADSRRSYDEKLKKYYQDLVAINSNSRPHSPREKNRIKYRYTTRPKKEELFIDKYTNYIIAGVFIFTFLFIVSIRALISVKEDNNNTIIMSNEQSDYTLIRQDSNGNEVSVVLSQRSQIVLDSILNSKRFKNTQQFTQEEIEILNTLQ